MVDVVCITTLLDSACVQVGLPCVVTLYLSVHVFLPLHTDVACLPAVLLGVAQTTCFYDFEELK